MPSKLDEFTESEFLEFVKQVCAADFETEEQATLQCVISWLSLSILAALIFCFIQPPLDRILRKASCRRSRNGGLPMASRCSRASSSLQL